MVTVQSCGILKQGHLNGLLRITCFLYIVKDIELANLLAVWFILQYSKIKINIMIWVRIIGLMRSGNVLFIPGHTSLSAL